MSLETSLEDEVFQYGERLPPRTIRLMKVKPDVGAAPLSFELFEMSLEKPVHFRTLSYACGDDPPQVKAYCHGRKMYLKPNLSNALWRIRATHGLDPIWVDAICIHQNDLEEKTTQVRMMTEIYGSANHVLIWLGMEQPGDELAIQLLHQFAEINGCSSDPALGQMDRSWLSEFKRLDMGSKSWIALKRFLKKPWFTHAWTVQEFAVARTSSMLCGRHNFRPEILFSLANSIRVHPLLANQLNVDINEKVEHEDFFIPLPYDFLETTETNSSLSLAYAGMSRQLS